MDRKKDLLNAIKKCRRRINLAKLIDCGIIFTAAGGIFGVICELVSLIRPFYYADLAAGLCFLAGMLAGMAYAIYQRADMKQAAGRLDSFGLKERMITAYERMDEGKKPEDEFTLRQREDAFLNFQRIKEQIKIPLLPDKRHILALLLSVVLVIGMSLIPSPVRDRAQLQHQVQEVAEEQQKKLEEFMEALERVDMESLTEEQRLRLQELAETMQLSQEELAKADSWESLGAATERLDYKYEQAAQSLENLASQMDNPAEAGVATAEALAKAAANQDEQQLVASAGTPGTGSGDDGGEDGNGDAGNSQQNSGEGNDPGDGEGQKQGNGQSGQAGNGEENGSGLGEDGSGNGDGNSPGNGSGSGRGTGSSTVTHDYVSIPNDVADDASLSGDKNGDQNSDYYRQQNGLAWEGEHVDYNSVIGEYTDNAYEGIANGKYPNGMESVIREYFEKLNQ